MKVSLVKNGDGYMSYLNLPSIPLHGNVNILTYIEWVIHMCDFLSAHEVLNEDTQAKPSIGVVR